METAAPATGMVSRLEDIAADAPASGLTLGELTEKLGEQAFGVVLFVLAVPVCMPFLLRYPANRRPAHAGHIGADGAGARRTLAA